MKGVTANKNFSAMGRFGIGGLGGLLPILVGLLTIDIATIIDHRETLTLGIYVGYSLRVTILFVLGGIVALLNSDVTKPWTLLQLGLRLH
jgi:hypothetical protein